MVLLAWVVCGASGGVGARLVVEVEGVDGPEGGGGGGGDPKVGSSQRVSGGGSNVAAQGGLRGDS
eukprot:3205960-Alexandrium_andersonii.AAC.1